MVKYQISVIFYDLIHVRIEREMKYYKNRFKITGNTKYTSSIFHNIIFICEKVIKNKIINLANAESAFSVIVDETVDISRIE